MPSVSEKQRRAMQAAAHGKSTIGIPQKVGREFAAADRKKSSQFILKREKRKQHK